MTTNDNNNGPPDRKRAPIGTRTSLWFGHGCSGYRMHSEHERYFGLGMDTLVIVRSRTRKNAMCGLRSISGPRHTSNVWFVPRRPHPERSAPSPVGLPLRRSRSHWSRLLLWSGASFVRCAAFRRTCSALEQASDFLSPSGPVSGVWRAFGRRPGS